MTPPMVQNIGPRMKRLNCSNGLWQMEKMIIGTPFALLKIHAFERYVVLPCEVAMLIIK